MNQAHRPGSGRIVRLAAMVARYWALVRADLRHIRTSHLPMIDKDLPFWITTDPGTAEEMLVATSDDRDDAIAFARRLAETLPIYSRVQVTMIGLTVYTSPGTAERRDLPGKAW